MPEASLCGAPTRNGGTCGLVAGWGTRHVGRGRCRKHKGNDGGAPRGNDNAVTHGGYRSIFLDELGAEDRALFEAAPIEPSDALADLIRTLTLREVRVLRWLLKTYDARGGIEPGFGGAHDALTRIQAAKLRAIEARVRAESSGDDGTGELDALFSALAGDDDYQRPDA